MAFRYANVATPGRSRPGRLIPAGGGIWGVAADLSGPSASKRAANRVARKLEASRVAGKLGGNRVARWKSDMAKHPADTVMKTVREAKTVCFDFTDEGAVRAGETLTNPVVTFAEGAGTPALGPAAPNAADFVNSDGKKVKAQKGILVRMTGGSVGRFNARCVCTANPSGDVIECPMLVVNNE